MIMPIMSSDGDARREEAGDEPPPPLVQAHLWSRNVALQFDELPPLAHLCSTHTLRLQFDEFQLVQTHLLYRHTCVTHAHCICFVWHCIAFALQFDELVVHTSQSVTHKRIADSVMTCHRLYFCSNTNPNYIETSTCTLFLYWMHILYISRALKYRSNSYPLLVIQTAHITQNSLRLPSTCTCELSSCSVHWNLWAMHIVYLKCTWIFDDSAHSVLTVHMHI